MIRTIISVRHFSTGIDLTLLFLRLVTGIAFMFHGYGKIQDPFGWMGEESNVPEFFAALAAVSEFIGGGALALGLLTRIASFGIACTMIGAVYAHAVVMGDPFVNMEGGGSYEPALVFLAVSLVFMAAGPGIFSLDKLIFGENNIRK